MSGRGRPKGSLNKSTVNVLRVIRENYPNYNPITAMIKLAHEAEDVTLQLNAHKEVAQYMYPKRKAVEISGPDGDAVRVVADINGYEEACALLKEHGIDPESV
jgi:hypothetical protein